MAKLETDIQSDLVRAALHVGGHGQKLSNRFKVGIPDLGIQLPGMGLAVIEVKLELYPVKSLTVRINTTPKQKAELWRWRRAGCEYVGVFVCVQYRSPKGRFEHEVMHVERDIDAERFDKSLLLDAGVMRRPGELWDIKELVRRLKA